MTRNRTPQTFEKRLRERAKQTKREAKQADRLARNADKRKAKLDSETSPSDAVDPAVAASEPRSSDPTSGESSHDATTPGAELPGQPGDRGVPGGHEVTTEGTSSAAPAAHDGGLEAPHDSNSEVNP